MKKIVVYNHIGNVGIKFLIIFVLVLLLLIPIALVKNLISDRQVFRSEAVYSVLEPTGGQPKLEGIAIVVPYDEVVENTLSNGVKERSLVKRQAIFFPTKWSFESSVSPYSLKRGIFEVPVFNCDFTSSGTFKMEIPPALKESSIYRILWNEAQFCIGISNKKNFCELPVVSVNNKPLTSSMTQPIVSIFTNAIFWDMPSGFTGSSLDFNITAKIQGGEKLSIYPVAEDNFFKISSDWASPSFSGGWLPVERNVTESGFNADWSIPGFSTVFPKVLYYSANQQEADIRLNAESVTVSFITPIDNYKRTSRSVKYAILFLIIPFLAIFILEIFVNIKIHPVQYALIGIADVIFYLLLLAISEHLSFAVTYWISATAVTLAMLFYTSTIFRHVKWGFVFSALQIALYVFLFGTLQSEDYALLIGTLGLFAIVVLLMFLTRKIDWYSFEPVTQEADKTE